MNFAATIIKGSPIDRLWRGQRRLSGDIHGVRFRLAGTLNAGTYCAREVTADRVFMLQNNQSIQLEAMSVAPPAPAPAPVEPTLDTPPPGEIQVPEAPAGTVAPEAVAPPGDVAPKPARYQRKKAAE